MLLPVAVLGFNYFAFISGSAFPWLRFYLPALPLSLLCIAFLLDDLGPRVATRRTSIILGVVAVALAAVLAGPAIPASALAMTDSRFGSLETLDLQWVLHGDHGASPDERAAQELVPSVRSLTSRLDALHLPSGSIVVDTVTLCSQMAVLNSNHPHQFIVTSDRDFQRVLSDPLTFKAHYFLVPPNSSTGQLDAVNRQYPTLYEGKSGFARLTKQFNEPGCPTLRLYKVTGSPLGAQSSGPATRADARPGASGRLG